MNLEKQLGTILKQIIDQESLNYLKTNPFGVYQNLIDKDVAEHSARLILMTLLAKIPEKLERNNWDLETLIQYIQKECCLNQDAAETLANLYEKLFSSENRVNLKVLSNSADDRGILSLKQRVHGIMIAAVWMLNSQLHSISKFVTKRF